MRPLIPLVILLATLFSCSSEKKAAAETKAPAPEIITVKTAPAELRSVERSILITGSLQPDESVSVSSEVAGRVARISGDFGQTVRKGEVVAELETTEFQIDIDRKRAAISQTLARLGLDPNNFDKTPDSTPAIRQAVAQLEDAKSKYDSAAKLVQSGDISRERFVELEKTLRSREESVAGAKDEMRTQWASIGAFKADLKLSEKHKSDTQIRAPFDGTISVRMVSPGQYLKENTPVMTVVKNFPLRLRLDIPESAASSLQVGATLTFSTDAIPGESFPAVLRELNPTLDAKSRTLTAEARCLKNDPRLRPGMFVQAKLVTSAAAKLIAVPKSAVYTVAGLNKLFVIANGRASEKRFIPGQDLGGFIEVPGDQINAGDQVAITQLPMLTNNTQVRQ